MEKTIHNAVWLVCAFYHTDATKSRAKELVSELSSAERKLLISILNKTFDSADECQALTDKLIAIGDKDTSDAFIPIRHEKDKNRSSYGKTIMNVWRAIKGFFDARVTDKKLIKKMYAFSKQAILDELDTNNSLNHDPSEAIPNSKMFDCIKFKLSNSHLYDLDLTKEKYGLIFKQDFSKLKNALADEIILTLAPDANIEDEIDSLISDYTTLVFSNDFHNEFAGNFDVQSLSIRNIIEKIDQIGFENLSDNQKTTAFLYLESIMDNELYEPSK